MPKTILKLLVGFGLFMTAACVPGQPAPDLNTINTAIAQTLTAALTQTDLPGIPVTGDETATPTVIVPAPTSTPIAASPTSTALILPSLTFTPAVTPGVAQVTVSVPTNCRVGPGTAYTRVGALLVNEVAEVVGRHATRDYWIIRNPDRPGDLCWLWGNFATVTGNVGTLPLFTPPPAPTPTFTPTPNPSFDVAYNNLESCTGMGWWVNFELENHGSITFRSMAMVLRDTVTNTVMSLYSDDFTNRDGCNNTTIRDTLAAGEELLVSSPVSGADPRGHAHRVTITLCSNTGHSGVCVTEVIAFTP